MLYWISRRVLQYWRERVKRPRNLSISFTLILKNRMKKYWKKWRLLSQLINDTILTQYNKKFANIQSLVVYDQIDQIDR